MQMMPCAPFSIPSSMENFSQEHQQEISIPISKPIPNTSAKKRRNLPGTPDPDAEVIALSPKTLMATNRFVCEICNKGFQRDQNLQLHRRGHNLPWKLKQRANKDSAAVAKAKKVYVCPETSCVHHHPSRALGDLTGIKKHYSRKHGEKKWKCDKCSKKYAVQSDWKAHTKTCGNREYRCDCGTLFSRKDTFITHRAFCDALVEERARIVSADSPTENFNFNNNTNSNSNSNHGSITNPGMVQDSMIISQFGSGFNQDLNTMQAQGMQSSHYTSSPIFGGYAEKNMARTSENASLIISPSPFVTQGLKEETFSPFYSSQNAKLSQPTGPMSATALLQKAAQMGASTRTNPSLFSNVMNSSSSPNVSSNPHSQNAVSDHRFGLIYNQQQQHEHILETGNELRELEAQFKLNNIPGWDRIDFGLTRDFLGMRSGNGDRSDGQFFSQDQFGRFASMG